MIKIKPVIKKKQKTEKWDIYDPKVVKELTLTFNKNPKIDRISI